MQGAIQENTEVELGIIDHLPGIMVRPDERVSHRGRDYLHNKFFCAAHCLTTS